MFSPFRPLTLLPSIKDDGNGMGLSLTIERELPDEPFPSRLDVARTVGPNLSPHSQQIVAIDNQMFGHKSLKLAG